MTEKEELLKIRKKVKKKKPKFKRQEWFKKKALGEKWRKPRGSQSKLRRQIKARGKLPSPGYGSPSGVHGLNREGYREVLVNNTKDIKNIDPKEEVAIIASTVGKKKRLEILEFAEKNKIKVGNSKFT